MWHSLAYKLCQGMYMKPVHDILGGEDLEVAVSACKFPWHFINPAKLVELLTVNDIEKPPCFAFPIET